MGGGKLPQQIAPVLTTISQDCTNGLSSNEEANLVSLFKDPGPLVLNTDSIRVSQVAGEGGNHALQDYQMQLMLLEQQNKKGLMIARQKQDKAAMASPTDVFRKGKIPPHVPILNSRRRATQNKNGEAYEEIRFVHTQGFQVTATQSEKPTLSRKRRNIDPASPHSRPKRGCQNVDGDDSTTISARSATSTTDPKMRVLHRIVCSMQDINEYHSATLFEDEPQRILNAGDHRGHFSGSIPVYDVEKFSSKYGLGFLVLRDHFCQTRYQIHSHGLQKSSGESISIVSNEMQEKVARIAECSPILINPNSLEFDSEDQTAPNEFEVASPYNFFFHHRERLNQETHLQNGEPDLSILALLQYLEEAEGERWREADELFSRGQTTLQHLQRLFRPNEVVIARSDDIYSAYMLRDWPHINSDSTWRLICWSWGFDGSWFRRKDTNLTLAYPFGEVIDIKNLGVFPLRFAPKAVTDGLIERGKHIWALRHKHYVSYTGWDFQGEEYHSSARFMIDYQTYRKMHQNASAFTFSEIVSHPFDRYRNKFSGADNVQTEDFLLMPAYIHGFFLKDKKWISLYVDKVQPISWNKEAFQRLVLPSRTKDLVKALVSVRTTGQGKGNGLIMLLHGGPGTGKTLTAESVAEIAEMPLYSVTCGDIGTTAEGVEKYLKTILYLGKTWNCVLLLDEADIFLEERTLQDLERNSLVSVFLRVLEYYEGILILTSNRVGIFDEAFKSRIQVALHYETLSQISRKKIWQNFFDMLQNDEENVDFQDLSQHLDELAEKEMNGREIRNALTTARQIAIYKKETLCWEHVEMAIDTARDFTRYLGRLHGHTDEQWAREKKER